MRKPLTGIALFLFAQLLWGSVLLNGTAGRVGKTIITVEDVRFFDAVIRLRDTGNLNTEPDAAALKAATQKLVFEEMVLAEMKSLQLEQGGRAAAEEQLKKMRAKAGEAQWKALLTRYQRTEAAVLTTLSRSHDVEKFLQKKIETLTPVVTEAEAQRYFRQNESKFYGQTFESIRPTVIRLLQKQEMEKGLGEWVRLLRDKHHAMNLLDR